MKVKDPILFSTYFSVDASVLAENALIDPLMNVIRSFSSIRCS